MQGWWLRFYVCTHSHALHEIIIQTQHWKCPIGSFQSIIGIVQFGIQEGMHPKTNEHQSHSFITTLLQQWKCSKLIWFIACIHHYDWAHSSKLVGLQFWKCLSHKLYPEGQRWFQNHRNHLVGHRRWGRYPNRPIQENERKRQLRKSLGYHHTIDIHHQRDYVRHDVAPTVRQLHTHWPPQYKVHMVLTQSPQWF